MVVPEIGKRIDLARTDVAPQRDAVAGFATHSTSTRARGPHPLPVFLNVVSRVCGGDRPRLARVLAGLRRYQAAPMAVPRLPRPEVARRGNASLRDHGGSGATVIVVPSLINPPTVLDLAPDNSLLAGLAARGLHPLLVDWGDPEDLNLAELVAERLVPLVAGCGAPVALAGYCLGGTLALGAAALLGDRVSRLALLATPWHFGGYGDAAPALGDWWHGAKPLAEALGAVPMDLLQPAFWQLDPDALVAKYERLASLVEPAAIAAFVTLEDWSNNGLALALPAARELFESLFIADATGRGHWTIAGTRVDPGALAMPILDIIAARDRIVPAAAALSSAGPGTPLPLAAGHVGMVVGSRAPELLWDPLAQWLRR